MAEDIIKLGTKGKFVVVDVVDKLGEVKKELRGLTLQETGDGFSYTHGNGTMFDTQYIVLTDVKGVRHDVRYYGFEGDAYAARPAKFKLLAAVNFALGR